MSLYVPYFDAILREEKCVEGRAFKESPKNYPDIRTGDRIRFAVFQERDGWYEQCLAREIRPDCKMEVDVGDVLFYPSVQTMYQDHWCDSADFQPMVYRMGIVDLLHLRHAAVYYTFPDYPGLIERNGFLGIEVLNPRIVA